MQQPLPWKDIDTVFLDMDGTLLDLHFDNHFWQEHVPLRYAEKHELTLEQAKEELYPRFRAVEGTMDWYCVDYWSRELGMDIDALKRELEHLIRVHPHVDDFLTALRASGRRVALLTNAHQRVVELKMATTGLAEHFDHLICAHAFRVPKEDPRFWPRLAQEDPFDPQHTLFVDDSLPVLRAARDWGIRYLRAVRLPDSRAGARETEEFVAIENFDELLRGLAEATESEHPEDSHGKHG
ncbi:MAG TPA: GMP/IMP nucleotidase [Gammaproteobacteria bacterium]|nr:GMP/IMP nucleotidase [Gammaproteobacteria bacterium]